MSINGIAWCIKYINYVQHLTYITLTIKDVHKNDNSNKS